MYKANGVTKSFPLPEGRSGDAVYWIDGSGGFAELRAGTSYVISGGNAVFGEAPPDGVTVAFERPAASEGRRDAAPKFTVVYPDGRIEAVYEDPGVLLSLAGKEAEDARKTLDAARLEAERILSLARGYEATARETLSSKLDRYKSLVEDAVTRAAAGARDELDDSVGEKLLEIRRERERAEALREEMERVTAEARGAADRTAKELCERLCAEGRELLAAIGEAKKERGESERAISEARREMDAFRAETRGEFQARSEMILEEFRSLKRVLDTEVKSVTESAKRTMDSLLAEMRAESGEMRNAVRHVNRVERTMEERQAMEEKRNTMRRVNRAERAAEEMRAENGGTMSAAGR